MFLFGKVGACHPGQPGVQAAMFACREGQQQQQQLSSIISRDGGFLSSSHSFREVSSTSQTLLYLPEGSESYGWHMEVSSRRPSSMEDETGDRAPPLHDNDKVALSLEGDKEQPLNGTHGSYQTFQKDGAGDVCEGAVNERKDYRTFDISC